MLTPELASRFAAAALANVVREYPGKLDHVLGSEGDVLPPRVLHPVFYGSFDWHSCVHMHWLLVRVLRLYPDSAQAGAIAATLDRNLRPEAVAGEVAYLARPGAQAFERTYGWAWLLKLAEELGRGDGADFARWRHALAPLAAAFVDRFRRYLPKASLPLRTGVHPNSAFGLAFALDYARASRDAAFEALVTGKALAWYADDRDCPAGWEPSGSDFLSPALMEADLMRRVLAPAAFASWLDAFLPGLDGRRPATLFAPAVPTDRGDPQIVHLDGLNLSRAWCLTAIANGLPAADPRVAVLHASAAAHREAGMAGLASDDYFGAHWLASFAALAVSGA